MNIEPKPCKFKLNLFECLSLGTTSPSTKSAVIPYCVLWKVLYQEWKNCFASLWIIFELFFVVAMLSKSPHSHLVHAGRSKQKRRHTLGHHTKGEPCPEFVSVVGARDKAGEEERNVSRYFSFTKCREYSLKQRCQRISVGYGYFSDTSSWRP